MHQVLVIAFAYPPVANMGCVRPAGLAKYLPQFGWHALVLTPKDVSRTAQPDVIETDYRDQALEWKRRLGFNSGRSIHEQLHLPVTSVPGSELLHTKLLRLAKHLVSYPDARKGWIKYALDAVRELRRQGRRIDAIISTSPPITTHLIARQAKRILGCPWIADFRDLWTQNLNPTYSVVELWQTGLEKRTLGDADALVTVSEPWADRLRRRYPRKSIHVITNGFDPEDFPAQSAGVTRQFCITHAGTLYEGHRDPSRLFEAVRDLIGSGHMNAEDIRIRFYGPKEPWLAPMAQQYGLERVVEIFGTVPREEVMHRETESQILLLLCLTIPGETGLHNGKLFEYLGAGRPILALGGTRGVMNDVLEETRAGIHALSQEELRQFLMSAYSEYKQFGIVRYRGDAAAIAQYTHASMAKRFANVLDAVSGKRTIDNHAAFKITDVEHRVPETTHRVS